jgi:hypothetical protein
MGGANTKGMTCAVQLSAGQVHESTMALPLTKDLPKGRILVGEKAYDTNAHPQALEASGTCRLCTAKRKAQAVSQAPKSLVPHTPRRGELLPKPQNIPASDVTRP